MAAPPGKLQAQGQWLMLPLQNISPLKTFQGSSSLIWTKRNWLSTKRTGHFYSLRLLDSWGAKEEALTLTIKGTLQVCFAAKLKRATELIPKLNYDSFRKQNILQVKAQGERQVMGGHRGSLNIKGVAFEAKSLFYCDWQSVWIIVTDLFDSLHWGLTWIFCFLFWSDCKQIVLHMIHLHLVSAYVPVSTSGSNIYPVMLPPTQHPYFLLVHQTKWRADSFSSPIVQIVSLFSLVFNGSHYPMKAAPPSYRVQLLQPHHLHNSIHAVVAHGLKTRQHLHLCPMCSQSVPSSPLDQSPPKAIRVSICPQQVTRVTPVFSCGHALSGGNTITELSLQ